VPKPDLYVYLHKDTDLLLKNIARRGRSYETYITKQYLEKITQGYFGYFRQQSDFPILIIDTNGIDFVNQPEDFKKLQEAIFNTQYNKGITRLIL
jgi:deoxyadenosine/deoxycytidine kinase